MNKEDRFSPPATGGISLLVAFATLCLTVFALLCLATVQARSRLAEASFQAVREYYGAENEAFAVLARLRAGQTPVQVVKDGDYYSFSCPISRTQTLEVEVRLSGTEYTVLRWQAVSHGQQSEEKSLNLWDGNDFG